MKEMFCRNFVGFGWVRAGSILGVFCFGAFSLTAHAFDGPGETHGHHALSGGNDNGASGNVWHPDHGWLYAVHLPDGMVWYWNYAVREWLAMHENQPDFIYAGTEDAWLWHMGGGPGNRSFLHLEGGVYYRETHGLIMPEAMADGFDLLSFATESDDLLDDDWLDGLMLVLLGVLLSPEDSECPTIAVTPEDFELFDPPPALSVAIDFGGGCQPMDDLGWFSGDLALHAEDLIFGETGGGALLKLEANALEMDGVSLLDGEMSIDLQVEVDFSEEETGSEWISTTLLEIGAGMVFRDLKSVNQSVDGRIDLSADLEIIAFESPETWEERMETRGVVTVTMADFSADDVSVSSGTVSLTLDYPGITTLSVDVQSDAGPILFDMEIDVPPDESGMRINSVGDSNILGGSLVIDNLRWDYDQCEDFPVSGSVRMRYGNVDYVITFTGDCEDFILRKE